MTGISAREREVLALLAEGLTDRRSGRLGISPRTVETHVGSLLSKLGVRNRAQAAAVIGTARRGRRAARPGLGRSPGGRSPDEWRASHFR